MQKSSQNFTVDQKNKENQYNENKDLDAQETQTLFNDTHPAANYFLKTSFYNVDKNGQPFEADDATGPMIAFKTDWDDINGKGGNRRSELLTTILEDTQVHNKNITPTALASLLAGAAKNEYVIKPELQPVRTSDRGDIYRVHISPKNAPKDQQSSRMIFMTADEINNIGTLSHFVDQKIADRIRLGLPAEDTPLPPTDRMNQQVHDTMKSPPF